MGRNRSEKNLWAIPAVGMKKKRPHRVPLSPQMPVFLEVMKPISANKEYVFPADRNPGTHAHPATASMALKRMGYGRQLVAHGLRALASTILNEQGFDPDIIESALAHIDTNDVRGTYNRAEYLERRRIMIRWWSDYIESSAEGNLNLSGARQLKVIN